MQMGIRPETIYAQQTSGNVPNFPSFYPPHIMNPMISPQSQPQPNFGVPIIPTPQAPSTQQTQPQASVPVADQNDAGQAEGGVPGPGAGVAEAPPVVPVVEPQNEPQPRFPHILLEEQPENRDWLDIFYTMSRLFILLMLVYFYSSPLRCLLVIVFGAGLYL